MKNPRETVESYYEEVINRRSLIKVERFVSEDYIDHNSASGLRGPEVLRSHLTALWQTFPDFSIVIEDLIVEGDRVASRISGSGTHEGSWMGIEPTGRRVRVKGINIDRVRGGRICEHWGEADTVAMLGQMGLNLFPGS